MLKKLLLAVIGIAITMSMSGCTKLEQYNKLDDGAMGAYMDMFNNVLEYGDPARAMMKEYKIEDPDMSNEDIAESIKAITEEYNMRVTGDIKMFTKEDAKPDEVKHTRIISVCSLRIAKIFLNHSRYYGGFMPCRVMLVEYGNGDRYLITMDLTLAIHGGYTLPPEMLKEAMFVQKAMHNIPSRAAKGDF